MFRNREHMTFGDHAVAFLILNVPIWAWVAVGGSIDRWPTDVVFIFGAVGVAAWYWRVNRRIDRKLRPARRQCAACGYDLREAVGACPECGEAVPAGHRRDSEIVAALAGAEQRAPNDGSR
ncbi:MAG TPA: zinc ribbon domain-containing protein [Tepidisphaeraceae bacterium]|nr:zinc ribbon domain-containing protein [Tepidisphaeraceae bacterium]